MGNINYAVSDANEVARYFLAQRPLTHKQVHKLLFFAYMEYLQENNTDVNSLNNQLFKNKFEAWVHGPVYAPIYKNYAEYGNSMIELLYINSKIRDSKIIDFLDTILNKYEKFNGDQLEALSHKIMAWQKARGDLTFWDISNKKISDEDIYNSEVPL